MDPVTRRDFLKIGAAGLSSLILIPRFSLPGRQDFPVGDLFGRVNVGKLDIKMKPDAESQTVGTLYEDAVIPWLHEMVGTNLYRTNQRWVETADMTLATGRCNGREARL